jgi:GT2 family glycosyltransferase
VEVKVSVIIPTYRREALLCDTIRSVLRYRDQYHELIVVDQTKEHEKETGLFLEKLASKGDIVHVIQDAANLPGARNTGIKAASGNIVLFLDDDVSIGEGFIAAHTARHQEPRVGCVTGKVEIQNREAAGNVVLRGSGRTKKTIKKILFFFLRKKASYAGRFGVLADFTGNRPLPADTAIGCNMSYKREVFNACGGFDSRYEGNAVREDTDMCVRVRKNGYRILYEPRAALVHYMENSGGSRASGSAEYWRVFFRNQCFFYIKNFGSGRLLIKAVLFPDLRRCRKSGLDEKELFGRAYGEALELGGA